jgi:poly(3-hydroxybutyrate) depolymerase
LYRPHLASFSFRWTGRSKVFFADRSGVCFKNGSDKGEVCTVEPAEQQLAEWLKKDRCSEVPRTVYHNGAASCYSYDGCAKSGEVEFCRIEGGGHAWPSGAQYAPASKIGPVSYDMSFDQIWDFLKRHRLQKQR